MNILPTVRKIIFIIEYCMDYYIKYKNILVEVIWHSLWTYMFIRINPTAA